MQKFLIEFRLHGYAKYYAKNLSKEISESFNIPSARRVVPHITLYGPATTNDIKRVISIVQRIGQKYTLVPFTINGFGNYAEHSNVIYLDVAPSSELKALRQELSDALQKISSCSPFDKTQEFGFHSTIALKVTSDKLSQIWNYIKQKKAPNIQQHLLRITILRYDRTILCEYDLVLKKMLSRRKALSRFWWRRTISKYKESKLLKTRDAKSIYFIGDLHLYHANIIKYCGRPFSNVHEMNRVLISNWRHAIKADDTVYFLGDVPGPRPPKNWLLKWLPKLTGEMHWIRGNHDHDVPNLKEYEICEFGQYKFLMVHNPDPEKWPEKLHIEWDGDGWIIHGHVHNNDPKNYPFINGEKKTINVSVEVIDYKPVSLDYLLRLDLDSIQRMDTIKSKPKRWEH